MVTAHGQALSSLPTYTLSQMLSLVNSASLHTNVGCVLVYIPSLVGGPMNGLQYYKRGIRAMYSEVTPYIPRAD